MTRKALRIPHNDDGMRVVCRREPCDEAFGVRQCRVEVADDALLRGGKEQGHLGRDGRCGRASKRRVEHCRRGRRRVIAGGDLLVQGGIRIDEERDGFGDLLTLQAVLTATS